MVTIEVDTGMQHTPTNNQVTNDKYSMNLEYDGTDDKI